MLNLNFPILELAYVTWTDYNDADASGAGHFSVNYLVDVNGIETVAEFFPTTLDQLMNFPMIDMDTSISVMKQEGNVTQFVRRTSVRELSYDTNYREDWEFLKNSEDQDLGTLLKEYVEESSHSSWEGYSAQEIKAVYEMFKDMVRYAKNK